MHSAHKPTNPAAITSTSIPRRIAAHLTPLVVGAALVSLAILEKESTEISIVFASGGVLILVLSLFAKQLESLEIGSAKAVLREARKVAAEEDLTVEEKGDEIIEILDPKPSPAQDARAESARARGERFERSARRFFVADGWKPMDDYEGPIDFGFDFLGERDGHVLVAEFKARSRLASADVASAYEQLEQAAKVLRIEASTAMLVLAVPTGSITNAARAFALALSQEDPRFKVVTIEIDE